MSNAAAAEHARNAQNNAGLARSFTTDKAQLTIAQAIYELAKAVEELAKKQA